MDMTSRSMRGDAVTRVPLAHLYFLLQIARKMDWKNTVIGDGAVTRLPALPVLF
ncbi:hypothetical protein HYU19_01755 [Candidatus Woesearchaeota archaeon]|nr:hypothetical protein [Candidatus Woesearchaeota archaeon]